MIVVDTTVLVYALGGEHPLRAPSRRVVQAIERGELAATSTAEVIQEFVHVRTRRHGRDDAASLGRLWAALLSPLLATGGDDLELALELYPRHAGLCSFDCLLAAAAIRRDAEALVSGDSAFGGVPGLRYVDLATPALDDLLGG